MKLPEKPNDFNCEYVGINWTPTIDCPKERPRSAKFVVYVDWSWSPAHSRGGDYYLSTNKSRTHWILWNGNFDDWDSNKWIFYPYAICPRKGIPAKTAAFYLVLEAWKNEMGEGEELYNKPFNIQEGLLSEDDLDLIADLVWPETKI